ncbi:MAG TPA: (Fe-S)-binding protein [Acidimicrobiia bacterium]|nr:(Fe-S)-binding protein [Acidimicrobiia bacterium]
MSPEPGLDPNRRRPDGPTVALFVTCVVDQIAPDVGVAAVRLLEAAGCRVEFPTAQTCCGQPAANAGEPEAAGRLARHMIDVFAPYDAVVAPSGSCAAMVHHSYDRLISGPDRVRAEELSAKTFELCQYLVDELGCTDVGARLDATVTFHDACHGLRNLGIGDAPRRLLTAAGVTLVDLADSETCCGFGGTFSLEYGDLAAALADDKLAHASATGAEFLASGDSACVAHLEGRRRRTGSGPEPIHVAELLARGLPAPVSPTP